MRRLIEHGCRIKSGMTEEWSCCVPSPDTLERFIARVESNKHVEAIQEFYAENASMQENTAPPRVGRDTLVAHEAAALARASSVESTCVRPVFVNGDHVVVRWIFEFAWKDGSSGRIEELAYQRWEGERIAQEQFFYDPKQFVPRRP
jgi:hypothetical protein